MECALGDRPFAEEADRDRVAPLQRLALQRQRQTDGQGQTAGDDRVATPEAGGAVEQMHGPAVATRATLLLAIHLSHDRVHRHPAQQRMAMLAVGGDHIVLRLQVGHHPSGDRLLADVEVQKTADLAFAVELSAALLKPPDAQHVAQSIQAEIA